MMSESYGALIHFKFKSWEILLNLLAISINISLYCPKYITALYMEQHRVPLTNLMLNISWKPEREHLIHPKAGKTYAYIQILEAENYSQPSSTSSLQIQSINSISLWLTMWREFNHCHGGEWSQLHMHTLPVRVERWWLKNRIPVLRSKKR